MKGMLGEIADTKGTVWEMIKDWRKFWRLRLIKWIAGDRAVLMNLGVEGLLVLDEDRDLLVSEAWLSDDRMADMRQVRQPASVSFGDTHGQHRRGRAEADDQDSR